MFQLVKQCAASIVRCVMSFQILRIFAEIINFRVLNAGSFSGKKLCKSFYGYR